MYHTTAFRATPAVRGAVDADGPHWTQVHFWDADVTMFVGEADDPASVVAAVDALSLVLDRVRRRAAAEIAAKVAGEAVPA
jgi:hypothetical protein